MAKKEKTICNGIFFDKEELQKLAKEHENLAWIKIENRKEIQDPHITLQFKPNQQQDEEFKPLIGQKVEVTISQYGSDGNNEGFRVSKIKAEDEKLKEMCKHIPSGIPHITTAVNGDIDPETGQTIGKPIDTYKLFDGSNPQAAKDIEPIKLTGTVGAYKIVPHKGPQAITEAQEENEKPKSFEELMERISKKGAEEKSGKNAKAQKDVLDDR